MNTKTYDTVIGLETHVQLATQSKAFCGDRNEFGGEPNQHISAISLGYPGTLPRLNETQLAYAVRLGLALGCTINRYSSFDRKNYSYADLPKGYQITQDRAPICLGGALPIRLKDGSTKAIRIHHIHMEEDAGKSIHLGDEPYSYVDLNRAGTPLVEIVTEPDLCSAEEVDAFMSGMQQLVRYLGISDGNMQEGSMRCDVNISVKPKGQEALGQRCEIKNLNSMRYARNAIAYEVERQIRLVEAGEQVQQQTRQFDPKSGKTSALRDKEDAHDYRYFPEPDLPPIRLSEAYIEARRSEIRELPWEVLDKLVEDYQVSLEDALIITQEAGSLAVFQRYAAGSSHIEALAKLFVNKIIPWVNEHGLALADFPLSPESIAELLDMIVGGEISTANAYNKLLPALLLEVNTAPASLAKKLQLLQNDDADFLESIAQQVLAENPDKVQAYQKGKKGLLGFFMGEVMKRSKGQAAPKESQALLTKMLEK